MARGISRIAKRGSGRHAETVMTVGRWSRGSEEALRNDAKIESSSEEALGNDAKIESIGERALRNVAIKKSGDPRAATPYIKS